MYALYTMWPSTVEHFGTRDLIYTLPFVLFGMGRYLSGSMAWMMFLADRQETSCSADIPPRTTPTFERACTIFALLRSVSLAGSCPLYKSTISLYFLDRMPYTSTIVSITTNRRNHGSYIR